MRLYFSKTEQYAVVVLLLAIIGALFVLSFAYGKRERESEQQPFYAAAPDVNAAPLAGAVETPEVVVHVTGAVNKPGVYRFPPGRRVNDAVRQAGGARADGDADALNLAATLQDGERLYIPTKTEWKQAMAAEGMPALVTPDAGARNTAGSKTSTAPAVVPSTGATHAAHSTTTTAAPPHYAAKTLPKQPISLNTATLEQLHDLPGIGDITAQKILDYRKEHGKFTDTAQILNVPGIGPKTYSRLSPYITL